ncbi:MAG: hypothetical protein K0S78_6336, partial [Thermomicrobiales bacterium]|nr:hypothetical protein [Thermomicrobiales bacterium]
MTSTAAGPERISVEAATSRATRDAALCSRSDLVAHAHEVNWHPQIPGKKRRQRQRALGHKRAIEGGDDTPHRLHGHRMVTATKKQRWGWSVPGNPVRDTAKQQAAATAG